MKISLYPKQTAALQTKANAILFGGSAGSGKMFANSILILSPDGNKTMGEIQVGDRVFDKDGVICNVVAKSEVDYDEQAYKITFVTGETVIAGASHEWLSLTNAERAANLRRLPESRAKRRANRPSRGTGSKPHLAEMNRLRAEAKRAAEELLEPDYGFLRTTQEMYETQFRVRNGKVTDTPNHAIPVCKPLQLPEKELPIDPYILGVWLGDGSSTSPSITNGDRAVIDEVIARHPSKVTEREIVKIKRDREEGKLHYCIYLQEFVDKLRDAELLDNKHIPEIYFQASEQQRRDLLAGIMDADGYVEKNGAGIGMVRKELIQQIRRLACGLGYKCLEIGSKRTYYTTEEGERVDCRKFYRFLIQGEKSPFYLERKIEDYKEARTKAKRQWEHRLITSIEPVDNPGMQCIQVDSPSRTYLITEAGIPTHNSHLIRTAAIVYSMEIEGLTTYLFRRNFKDLLANHVYCHGGFLNLLGDLMKQGLVKFNKSEYVFEFSNKSRIQLAHSNNPQDIYQYLGTEIQCAIIDESTQFTQEMLQFIISRMRLGGLPIPEKYKEMFPRLLLATNPLGLSHEWHKKRFVDFGTAIHKWPDEWGGFYAQYIPAFLTDNKVLLDNDPNYAAKLMALGDPIKVKAYLEGDWNVAGNLALTDWHPNTHVIDPFRIPVSWKIQRAYDYGYSAPYHVLYYTVSNGEEFEVNGEVQSAPRGSVFIVGEIYGADEDDKGIMEQPSETARRIKAMDDAYRALGYKVLPGPADNAINNKDRGASIAEIMANEGVTWLPSDKSPGSRVLGLALINQMVTEATKTVPETPILKVFRTCPALFSQLSSLPRDSKKMEDVDTTANDHGYDCLRYIVLAKNKEAKVAKVMGI